MDHLDTINLPWTTPNRPKLSLIGYHTIKSFKLNLRYEVPKHSIIVYCSEWTRDPDEYHATQDEYQVLLSYT